MNNETANSINAIKHTQSTPFPRYKRGLMVFQRDLRLEDQRALCEALKLCEEVVLIAVFDPKCHKLPLETDDVAFHRFNLRARLSALSALKEEAQGMGIELTVCVGDTVDLLKELMSNKSFQAIFFNEVYEPEFSRIHEQLLDLGRELSIDILSYNDNEVVPETLLTNGSGEPYKVFTPFYKKWRSLLSPQTLAPWYIDSVLLCQKAVAGNPEETALLKACNNRWEDLSFQRLPLSQANAKEKLKAFLSDGLRDYSVNRDYPSLEGTSALSAELNNGLIGYRTVLASAYVTQGSESYIRQLAWKHFYILLLKHHPEVENTAFLKCFRALPWENDPVLFQAWKSGTTGIPLVDAAMREFSQQGTMHNRLRMVCASLLVKQLDTDWRLGESYFYEGLIDGDLALNNGGWQWCASTGTDAQPYFRIFNPLKQQETYDKNRIYIDKWLEPLEQYASPIVDLKIRAAQAKLKYQMAKRGVIEDEGNVY